jgi:HAD superfamily hydrolase (TIGR01549 family)
MYKTNALIFDLGNVILDIDQEKTIRAFTRMGLDLEALHYKMPLFNQYEVGQMTSQSFIHILQTELHGHVSREQIIEAWNSMLIFLPDERLRILEKLKNHFRLFILSNTNSIHMQWFDTYLQETNRKVIWQDLFEKQFLSHEIGLRKPDKMCYNHVCNDVGLLPQECIFIDDSLINVRGAEVAGLRAYHASKPLCAQIANDIVALARSSNPQHN